MPTDKVRYANDPEYRERVLARNRAWAKKNREADPEAARAKERAWYASAPKRVRGQNYTPPKKLGRILGLQCGWAKSANPMGARR